MSPTERLELIAAYISNYTRRHVWGSDMVLRESRGEDHFWAFEKMSELSRSEPDLCWELILQILHTPHEDSVTEILAAGPLEDLLVQHGERVIDRVEEAAATDALMKDLLGGVWKSSIPSPIWERVEACRGQPW
jgi:hypothetical protein